VQSKKLSGEKLIFIDKYKRNEIGTNLHVSKKGETNHSQRYSNKKLLFGHILFSFYPIWDYVCPEIPQSSFNGL